MAKGLHIIIGEDDFLVAEAAKKIVGDGDGLEVIDSNTSTNEELQLADLHRAEESAMTPPFLSPRKVTWWKNVRFLPGGAKGKEKGEGGGDEKSEGRVSQAVKEAVEAFAKRLAALSFPDNQQFILSGPRLLATSVVAKTLSAAGEMIVFSAKNARVKGDAAMSRAIDRAAELGLEFEGGAAKAFLEIVGTDTRSIYSELDKLKCYLGDAEANISVKAVGEITTPGYGVEPSVWQVTDAVCARNAEAAVSSARKFEGENGYAIMMTTMIERQFRQLVELKSAEEAGKLRTATAAMNPYAAEKMVANLRRWTLTELRTARMRFMNLREKLVSSSGTGGDEAVAIELVRALAPRSAGRRV